MYIKFNYPLSYNQRSLIKRNIEPAGTYTADDQGQFKNIVIFECRGLEPVEFSPGEGWIAKISESNKVFEDVDLSEKEWVDYDDNIKQSVGIYEFESQFIKMK